MKNRTNKQFLSTLTVLLSLFVACETVKIAKNLSFVLKYEREPIIVAAIILMIIVPKLALYLVCIGKLPRDKHYFSEVFDHILSILTVISTWLIKDGERLIERSDMDFLYFFKGSIVTLAVIGLFVTTNKLLKLLDGHRNRKKRIRSRTGAGNADNLGEIPKATLIFILFMLAVSH